jgi:hypothetical protein
MGHRDPRDPRGRRVRPVPPGLTRLSPVLRDPRGPMVPLGQTPPCLALRDPRGPTQRSPGLPVHPVLIRPSPGHLGPMAWTGSTEPPDRRVLTQPCRDLLVPLGLIPRSPALKVTPGRRATRETPARRVLTQPCRDPPVPMGRLVPPAALGRLALA